MILIRTESKNVRQSDSRTLLTTAEQLSPLNAAVIICGMRRVFLLAYDPVNGNRILVTPTVAPVRS